MTGAVLLALAPIAVLIGLGHGLRRFGILADPFWPQAERLAYYVLVPALFLHGLATARLDEVPVAGLAAVLVLSTTAVAALLVVARPLIAVGDPAFTSVFQGGVRFNNFVGVTAAAGLFGAQGVALAAVANAAIVPTVNVLCVLVFARYGPTRPTALRVAQGIASNPLVLGCAGGILAQATGWGLPPVAEPALRALGAAALPLGLLCVGAALDFTAIRTGMGAILATSAVKFLGMPIAAALACAGVGLTGPAAVTALLFQALPTAPSAYVMARQLGGDAPLMAGITAAQTVLAGAAIPVVLAVLLALVG